MATQAADTFRPHAARSARARRFYVALALFTLVIAFVGFWPTYFGPLLTGAIDKPAIIHFHAAVYVGWLAIFIAQTTFAATGRLAWHVRLGRIGIGYGVLVIGAGLLAGFGMFAIRVEAGDLARAQSNLVGPLLDMIVFAPFFAAAVAYRHKPELHKRLMIVATTALLIAAVGRMRFLGDPMNNSLLLFVWTSPILLAMGYDYLRRRIVHPIYLLGLVVLALEARPTRVLIRESDAWLGFTAWLATVVS